MVGSSAFSLVQMGAECSKCQRSIYNRETIEVWRWVAARGKGGEPANHLGSLIPLEPVWRADEVEVTRIWLSEEILGAGDQGSGGAGEAG